MYPYNSKGYLNCPGLISDLDLHRRPISGLGVLSLSGNLKFPLKLLHLYLHPKSGLTCEL